MYNDKRYINPLYFNIVDTDTINYNSCGDERSNNNYQEIFLSRTRSPSPPPPLQSSRKSTINPFKYIFMFIIYWIFWSFLIKNNNYKLIVFN